MEDELQESLKKLQEEREHLTEELGGENDPTKQKLIADNEAKITEIQDELLKQEGHARKPSRNRTLTEKGKQLLETTVEQKTSTFNRRYVELKTAVKAAYAAAKTPLD